MTTSSAAAMTNEIAGMLSTIADGEVTPIEGGFRIKETKTHWVDVLKMIWSWRIVTTTKDVPECYDRHWCYAGTSLVTLIRTVSAAAEWDGSTDTEPEGWNKNGQTREWREP